MVTSPFFLLSFIDTLRLIQSRDQKLKEPAREQGDILLMLKSIKGTHFL
ncbi:unnamed protein product, partial [Allacma fusca]